MPLAEVRPDMRCAWRGPALLIVDTRGECGDAAPLSGFYYREARFLDTLRFTIDGERLWLCESASLAPDRLSFSYVYPEIASPGGGGTGQADDRVHVNARGVPERALDVHVFYRLRVNRLEIALDVANRSRAPVSVEIACSLGADFADIQEALAGARQQRADVDVEATPRALILRYAHPQLRYLTTIHHAPELQVDGGRLRARVELLPKASWQATMHVAAAEQDAPSFDAAVATREEAATRWAQSFTRVTAGAATCHVVLTSNIRDIASLPLLTGPDDEWLVLQAGIPLYPAFFGRDALTAGWQAALLDGGRSLDDTLTALGRLQSTRTDDWHDEEPGRIPYQVRSGPLARLDLNPYRAYYADYASPLMFVIALANLFAWTGDIGRVRRHWDVARRIMEWARDEGDRDGDGYLEYQTRSAVGPKNQGWKDSGDAITYEDGTPVPTPIATCELQGYWYIAQELMALLSVAMGASGEAKAFLQSASALKHAFNRDWWMPEERFFALALDPDKRQVRALTSNVGHCLACGVIDREHVEPVVGRFFEPDLFSGWGIRTLSATHAHYDPISYHRGSVWAVEQATIVFGLRRFGFNARAADLARALFELASLYPEYRIPECVGGHLRTERATPGAYPRANVVQLWNATAFPLVIQSLLGLLPLAPVQTLVIDPVLPTWLPVLELRQLRVGAAEVSIRFERDSHGRTEWDVLHQRGPLHIVRQPAPESLTAGSLDRLRALWDTLVS